MICLRNVVGYDILGGTLNENSVRIIMGANVIIASIMMFLITIWVLVLGLIEVALGPTAVLMLLLLARIDAAYHFGFRRGVLTIFLQVIDDVLFGNITV